MVQIIKKNQRNYCQRKLLLYAMIVIALLVVLVVAVVVHDIYNVQWNINLEFINQDPKLVPAKGVVHHNSKPQMSSESSNNNNNNNNKLLLLPPPAYDCSNSNTEQWNKNKNHKKPLEFFQHIDDCGGNNNNNNSPKTMSIPKAGYIFNTKYFKTKDELNVKNVFDKVLSTKTSQQIREGVVLDIGGNSGWYSAYAAICYNTHVHVFEPQKECLEIMCPLLEKNNINNLVTIHHNIVAIEKKTIELTQGCDPGFNPDKHHAGGGGTREKDDNDNNENDNDNEKEVLLTTTISSVNAADFVKPNQEVLMVKIDTEGTEMGVLPTLEPMLVDGRITDIVVEIKTFSWKNVGKLDENLSEFHKLIYDNGFTVFSLEKQVYITKNDFNNWMVTIGGTRDNNFWISKKTTTK